MTYTDKVAEYLRSAALNKGQYDCARHLCVSGRTLNRRLEAEGTTYWQLADAERRRRAIDAIQRHPKINSHDLAPICGLYYSQSVVRAFRRWFGMTITDYKRAGYVHD